MKEKLTRNIGLKILSIILAAFLWLVITNVIDPISTKQFRDVKVDILHSDAITSLGQIYDIEEGGTIDFTVTARRTIRDDLSASDFVVTADLSKLSDVNAVTIKISCPRYGDQVTVVDNNQVMKVKLEELASKHFKVNVKQKGNPAEGYYVYEKTANTLMTVTGPRSKIDKIAEIVTEVDVTDIDGSFRVNEAPKALDADGKRIDATNLNFSQSEVPVYIGVYRTKKVDLNIIPTGKPADGYMVTKVDFEPKTIEVAAKDEVLNNTQIVTITEDISGASENIEQEVKLKEQLTDGLILVDDSQTAVVNIKIEKAQTKEIVIAPEDIEVRNKPDILKLVYLSAGPFTLDIKGPAKEIEDLSKDNIKPFIDLSNCSGGTYTVDIKADLSDYVTLENIPRVNISLMQ
jgi:Uncharacterized protein conserved in bacteria